MKAELEAVRDRMGTVKALRAQTADGAGSEQLTELADTLSAREKALLQGIEQNLLVEKECMAGIGAVTNPVYRTLLTLRYLKLLPWDGVAAAMHYEQRYIYKLHNNALAAFGRAIEAAGNN